MSRPRVSLVPAILVLASASVCLPRAESPPPEAAGDLRPRRVRELPFDLEAVEGLSALPDLPADARKLLAANGFVVVGPAHGSMPDCYRRSHEIPALVTVDSVLEVFLADLEEAWFQLELKQARRLSDVQTRIWDALLARWEDLPDGEARTAAGRLLGLLAVGRSLADPEWRPPADLPAGVDAEPWRAAWKADLDAALEGAGPSDSRLWRRRIDWSAFQPVGPYAEFPPGRERYFRLSQWWGLQGLRSREREERLVAAILAWVARPLDPDGPGHDLSAIEAAYDRFLGDADDVPLIGLSFGQRELGEMRLPRDFGTNRFDAFLVRRLETMPVPSVFSEAPEEYGDRRRGQGVRLLPPRRVPEARAFAGVTHPNVVGRFLPRGLDALAAFGDDRARRLTLEIEREGRDREALAARLDELRSRDTDPEAGGARPPFQERLRRLFLALAHVPVEERLPLFVRTEAYRDRGLSSALAAWAGVRALFGPRTRGNVGVGGVSELPGVAEPNLEAWKCLVDLWQAAESAFSSEGIALGRNSVDLALAFQTIAEKQLRGEPLTEAERARFPSHYATLLSKIPKARLGLAGDPASWTDRRTCAPFARSWSPDAVRWAGKACCRIYAVVEHKGTLFLCQGGCFDYRELDLPPGRALTAEGFPELMDSAAAPAPPRWTGSYRVEPAAAATRR